MSDARAAGRIYDLGYQRHTGPRLGRANAVRALVAFSFRAAFGVGRGGRARIVPVAVAAFVLLPAFVQVAIAAASGLSQTINYGRSLQGMVFFLALFVASQAPELVVTDRQHGVLSLYLSRSLRATDYAFAKLAALIGAVFALTVAPQMVLFLGGVFVNNAPWTAFMQDWKTLGTIVGGSVVIACYLGTTGLALAALNTRRAYASASVIAFFLLLPAASSIANSLVDGDGRRYAPLANPFAVMTGFQNWIFDVKPQVRRRGPAQSPPAPPPSPPVRGEAYLYAMLGTSLIAAVGLAARYRKAEV